MQENSIWNADLGNGTYKNPILYADYSDPDAIRVGEDYFLIASSFCNAPGLPLLHSKDLVNWKIINYILPKLPETRYAAPIHGCGVWAPALRYHDGIFYACFPMPDEGIYMSTTSDPFGTWSEPVNIRPGAGWIDPCPFWDDDGKAYLVAGVAKSRIGYKSVLHMVEMNPNGLSLIGEEIKIFDGNENGQVTIEGPKMYKRNGYYYIFAPAGGVKTGWQTVLRSKNIYGPYEYKVVMRQGDTTVNGPHQGAWVDTVTGEDWFIHFQDVYCAGRIAHLQPMTWQNDWPVIGNPVDGCDYGVPVAIHKKPNVGNVHWEVCEPDTHDNFCVGKLNFAWQWNANPKENWYSFAGDAKKNLLLHAVNTAEDTPYGNIPNLLLQKWPAPEFSCTTRLDLSSLCDGDTCGIISMGRKYAVIEFAKENGQIDISFVQGEQHFGKILVENTTEEAELLQSVSADSFRFMYIKYEVRRTGSQDLSETEKNFPLETVTISYSFGDDNYHVAGQMTAVPGRWVGVKNGPFCIRKKEGNGGYLTVTDVTYNRL